jgi:hypothetical protein
MWFSLVILIVCVLRIWYTLYDLPPSVGQDGTSSILIPLASSQHNLYDIYLLLCVQGYTPNDGQKTCPKQVEFYSKNKFVKLVHLVGFMIRIHHDARSSECQIAILCYEIYSLTNQHNYNSSGSQSWFMEPYQTLNTSSSTTFDSDDIK